jgi:hypothetical protein
MIAPYLSWEGNATYDTSRSQLKPIESRIKEIDCIIHDIEVYRQTKPVADKLETVTFKERYKREHESDLILFKAAEKSLRPYLKDGKLPLIKELRAEHQSLYFVRIYPLITYTPLSYS